MSIDSALDDIAQDIVNYFPVAQQNSSVYNIIEFADRELKITLFPRQRIILKVFYNLPLDAEELQEFKWLYENKGLKIPENYQLINFKELVIVAGRRGGKSVVASLIATYEVYRQLKLYNPQMFYGLIPGTPIYVLHCAAEAEQAKIVQDYIKGYINSCEFFKPYIDHISEKEIRFFTQFDKDNKTDKGSIRIYSLTSNSLSIPGRTAIICILDELARMMDTNGRLSGDKVYQALTPSIINLKQYARIVDISSPLTKGGIFYDLYEKSKKIESMLCFQYATWELNPNLTKDDLKDEYEKNPEWAKMEYGGEFGEVLDKAFDWDKIDKIIEKGKSINYLGQGCTYVVACDPATKNDRYGISWGHSEIRQNSKFIVLDGLKYYESQKVLQPDGTKKIIEIDLDTVDNFVIDLIGKLKNVSCIAYDQGKSTASIQKLKKKNFNAIETTFTNKYKEMLYNDMTNMLNQEHLKVYEQDEQNAVGLLVDELKYLERQIKGGTVIVSAPMIGLIRTDDLYSAVSNLVHILLEEDPNQIRPPITTQPRVMRLRNWG